MKLGLYKLDCSKYSPSGWFFIIDTSIQMGPQKCVVVLGVKKKDVNSNFCPTLDEVEPLVVQPLCSCPGEVIDEILEKAVKIAGTPIAIISDEGSENKKGVRLFCERHPEAIHLFDISHQINSILKKTLNDDPIWAMFKEDATNTIQNLKLTSIAHLAPPKQRTKARMHSSFTLVEWGLRLLQFVNSEKVKFLDSKEIEKIKWIKKYESALSDYICFRELCKEALAVVHEQGYYLGVANDYTRRTTHLCEKAIQYGFQNKIIELLKQTETKIHDGSHYLGSSEIIESLFGKFKALEGVHASSGLTSLVLSIPALTGKIDNSIVKKALETTSNASVEEWIEINMGQTYLSKRRSALRNYSENEEVIDLVLCD